MFFKPQMLASANEASGSHNSTLIMLVLAYWRDKTVIERDGFTWLVRSAEELASECTLTIKQYKTGLSNLKKKGLVACETHLFKNKRNTFLRLTALGIRALGLSLEKSPEGPDKKSLQGPIDEAPSGPFSITKSLDKEIKQGSLRSPSKPETEDMEKKTVSNPNPYKGSSVAEIMASAVSVKKPAPVTPGEVWKSLVSEVHKIPPPHLTGKDFGQLKLIVQTVTLAGLKQIIENWSAFVAYVKDAKGLKAYPSKPDLGFLLKFVSEANDLLNPVKQEAMPVVQPVKVPPAPVQSIAMKPSHQPYEAASLEETLAILGEDD